MDVTMRDMGERIKARRLALGLTQRDLGIALGKSQQDADRWEQGKSLRPATIIGLAQRLGCTTDHLLGLGDAPPTVSVEAAVVADPALDEAARTVVLSVYRGLVSGG